VFRDRVSDEDATVIRKLKAAGAILLGKTNMHEMAMGGTSINPHYGSVRNPWASETIAGGSSGGAASCLGLHIGYAALGTDSAGSVRIPASLSGVVGLKATHGLVSLTGCVPTITWHTDHIGPLTKSVADASLMLSVMRGHDPSDPDSSPRMPESYPPLETLDGLRVGVPGDYFWEGLEEEVGQVCRGSLELMRQSGAESVGLPFKTVQLMDVARVATAAEGFLFHEPHLKAHPEDYSPDLRYRILAAQYIMATDYIRAMRVRRLIMEEIVQAVRDVDVMVMPTVPIPAFPIDSDRIQVGDKEVSLKGPAGSMILLRNTQPMNWAGVPAISIPAGLSSGGLPVGIQIVSAPFQDLKLLSIAMVLEKLIGFDALPKVLGQGAGQRSSYEAERP
jgi:aspartyl-tRNA(Asn)/glutamyl-tRNA(Gln) amidotransferase subunit A